MADNSTQIKTRFSLEGVQKALAELKGFTQGVRAAAVEAAKSSKAAKGGFESVGNAGVKAGSEVLTSFNVLGREIQVTGRGAFALGVAFNTASKTITTALSGVLAVFRGIRNAAAATFASIAAGARAAAGAIRGAFGAANDEAQAFSPS